jgi:hypothetical protein
MLAEKRTPRFMQDRLYSYLEPSNHFDIDRQLRGVSMTPIAAPAPMTTPPAAGGTA